MHLTSLLYYSYKRKQVLLDKNFIKLLGGKKSPLW